MATEAKTKKTAAKKPATKKKTTKKATSSAKPVAKKTTTKKVTPVKKETKVVQEENNYKNTVIAAVIIALIFLGGIFAIKFLSDKNSDANYQQTADEAAFQKAYESLNGTAITKVEIIKNNNIVYIDMKEAATILDSGSGVIYFGYSADEFARNAVPVLLDAMSASELEKIYYVDLRPENNEDNDVRDLYTLNKKNKATIAREASVEYEAVRTALANYLDDYVLYTSKNKKVNTGKTRLESPTVVSVVEGQILGYHEGTVANHVLDKENKLPALTKEQEKELKTAYTKVISSQLNKKCEITEGC